MTWAVISYDATLFCTIVLSDRTWYKSGKRFIGLSRAGMWETKINFYCPALRLIVLRSLEINHITLCFYCSDLQNTFPTAIPGSGPCILS